LQANRYSAKTKQNLFDKRDFVYFLRYLSRSCQSYANTFELTPEALLRALQRNFNGIPPEDFRNLVQNFFQHVNRAREKHLMEPWNFADLHIESPIQTLRESLAVLASAASGALLLSLSLFLSLRSPEVSQDRLESGADPNTSSFRYIMLIDPTDSEESISLLHDLGLFSPTANRKVLHAAHFRYWKTDNDRISWSRAAWATSLSTTATMRERRSSSRSRIRWRRAERYFIRMPVVLSPGGECS
jgi:hypothetical protein